MQNHYNLVYREEEREMIPLCLDQSIGCIPWSPLARGFLTGTRKRGDGKTETIRARTDDFGHNTLLPRYGLRHRRSRGRDCQRTPRQAGPGGAGLGPVEAAVSAPIIGASKPGHLEDALGSLELKLSEDEIKRLEELYEPHPVLGHSY